MAPSDSRRSRRPVSASRPLPSPRRVSPVSRITFPACCAHYLRRIEQVHLSIASPFVRPSPLCRRVGIRDFTFEACSGYHSRYGPPSCSTAQGGLCHEASIRPVAQPNRSSATRPIDNYLGGFLLHWLSVPFGAHCIIRVRPQPSSL